MLMYATTATNYGGNLGFTVRFCQDYCALGLELRSGEGDGRTCGGDIHAEPSLLNSNRAAGEDL